jgi:adenine C2-methylase RlmN of 23S rRNA A2503 and tRNA A37
MYVVYEHPEAKSSVRCKVRKNVTVVVSFLLYSGMQSGQSVEAVIMRHDAGAGKYAGGPRHGGPRATLCVSSQVGCQMGCTFCATGTMGLKGNLSAGEILEQLVHASQITPIRNIVFMVIH